jgi:hypothetical protein
MVADLRREVRMVRSDAVNYNDTSPVTIFTLPANTFLLSVTVEISTAFDGAIPSLAIGVSGDTDRHMLTSEIGVKTAGFYTASRPRNYTSQTDLLATIVASTATAGVAYVWLEYRAFSDYRI